MCLLWYVLTNYWSPLCVCVCVCVCAQVKLWRLCDPELQQPGSPELTLRPGHGRLELVAFHPTSSGLLAVGATKSPLLWDTSRQDAPLAGSYSWGHECQMFVCAHGTPKLICRSPFLYIMHCLLHLTFQSLSVSLQFLLCFYVQHVCICNWSGWFPFFFSLGAVWLTLPTFYSPVALSMCRSSRGNVFGLQSWSQSPPDWPQDHYPLASPSLHTHMNTAPSPYTPKPHDSWPGCCCSLLIFFMRCPPTHWLSSPSFLIHMCLRNNVWMIKRKK